MSSLPQELLDQFPPLPEHEAVWRAVYMEPIMCSGERITVAVIAMDRDGCEVTKTISETRLRALFGAQAAGMAKMIDLVADSVLRHGLAGSLENFKSPLSGVYLGEPRDGLGESRQDVLQQAASLTSCLYEEVVSGHA